MTAVQVLTAGLDNLLVALAISVAVFGGSALVMHRRDRRQLEQDTDR